MSRIKSRCLFPIALVAGFAALPVAAQDLSWEVINDSDLTLMELYASPVSAPGWSDDILGNLAIAPGEDGIISVVRGQDYCLYDFQFVMEDGSTSEYRTNICEEDHLTLE